MVWLKQILCFIMYISIIGGKSTIRKQAFNNNNLGFQIDSHTPDQVVVEGQVITLMCRVKANLIDGNDDWKTCRWSRLSDGVTCLFEYKKIQDDFIHSHWIVEEYCESSLGDVEYFGSDPNVENHICGINVASADQGDNSDWKCTIEECKNVAFGGCSANNGNGYTVEATMNVKVNNASLLLNLV